MNRKIPSRLALLITILVAVIAGSIVLLVYWQQDNALFQEEIVQDKLAGCFNKYPAVEYENCIPGQIIDGWSVITLYPGTLNNPNADSANEAGVARYDTSAANCRTTWQIKVNQGWKEVSQDNFCNYIINYDNFCDKCLLQWQEGCC